MGFTLEVSFHEEIKALRMGDGEVLKVSMHI